VAAATSLLFLGLFLAALLVYVRGPAGGAARDLRIAASASLLPLAEELGQAYHQRHPGVVVLVDPIRAGARPADLTLVTSGEGTRIGWRALVLAADPSLRLAATSKEMLARIFSQSVSVWAEMGGPDRPIVPVDRPASDGDHVAFTGFLYGAPRPPVANALLVPDDRRAAAAATRPGAIAYLGLRALAGLPALELDGVQPEPAAVRDGRYALRQPIGVQPAGGAASGLAAEFAAFSRSEAGQLVVDQHEVRG
jgi:phosphate transport system substrate-binding protein